MPSGIWKLPPYTVEQSFLASEVDDKLDWGLAQLGVDKLWKKTRGKGVRVAILDTGADLDHPDLKANIVAAKDFTGSRHGAQDVNVHGTHCAGIVAAADNGKGTIGVAPQAELLIAKVLGDQGTGSTRSIKNGIRWAIEHKADVISMSLGSPQRNASMLSVLQQASRKAIVICAAGNDGRADSVNWPARDTCNIAVASFNKHGQISRYSSRGPEVDIAAPGEEILSTGLQGGYATLSGTSMATPFVAGIVALMLAKKKRNLSSVRKALQETARDIDKPGRDFASGWGLIQPSKLITNGAGSSGKGLCFAGICFEPIEYDGRSGLFVSGGA